VKFLKREKKKRKERKKGREVYMGYRMACGEG
jgi:hypothetical protein